MQKNKQRQEDQLGTRGPAWHISGDPAPSDASAASPTGRRRRGRCRGVVGRLPRPLRARRGLRRRRRRCRGGGLALQRRGAAAQAAGEAGAAAMVLRRCCCGELQRWGTPENRSGTRPTQILGRHSEFRQDRATFSRQCPIVVYSTGHGSTNSVLDAICLAQVFVRVELEAALGRGHSAC